MTREEKIFEMAKAIAPTIANVGITLQNNLTQRGSNPQDCRIGDKDIPHAYGESLRVWANAFVDELEESEHTEENKFTWKVIDKYEALKLFRANVFEIFRLYNDGSEGACECLDDILGYNGDFGIELGEYKVVNKDF